jgi:integrase
VRIGEALATSWDDIDLGAGTARVEYTIVRLKGVGLLRKATKTAAGERTLTLPAFAVSMLRRRKIASEGRGPVFPDLDVAGPLPSLPHSGVEDLLGGAALGSDEGRFLQGEELGAYQIEGVDDP